MPVPQKFKTTLERVKELLEKDHTNRDDDEKLVARFWYEQIQLLTSDPEGIPLHPEKISGTELLKIYASGRLTSADEITRARRKCQETFPDTRGKRWADRHAKEVYKVSEINNSTNNMRS